MELIEIAKSLKEAKENIILVYAFNATGKTRLSVAYKDATKQEEQHAGVYYNAYSEDLFVWENEEETQLMIMPSSLNKFHSLLDEEKIREKLKPFKPKYNFWIYISSRFRRRH